MREIELEEDEMRGRERAERNGGHREDFGTKQTQVRRVREQQSGQRDGQHAARAAQIEATAVLA